MIVSQLWSVCCCCVFLYLSVVVTGTISPSDKRGKANKVREIKVNIGPLDKTIAERNLVHVHPRAKDIVAENAAYYKDTNSRTFNSTVLGYVTPVGPVSIPPPAQQQSHYHFVIYSGILMATK